MTTPNKRKHTHRRSSSLAQPEEQTPKEQITTLANLINSDETMQLLKESQNKSQFQVIVDSFDDICQEKKAQVENNAIPEHQKKEFLRNTVFNEYFQIQSVQSLKRQDSERSTFTSDQLTLENLQSEPRINGRLRYHRNIKEKAFTMSTQKLQLFETENILNFDEICCKLEYVKV